MQHLLHARPRGNFRHVSREAKNQISRNDRWLVPTRGLQGPRPTPIPPPRDVIPDAEKFYRSDRSASPGDARDVSRCSAIFLLKLGFRRDVYDDANDTGCIIEQDGAGLSARSEWMTLGL